MRDLGLRAVLSVQWRIQRRRSVVWVIALAAGLSGTAASVAGLYDTPSKIHSYAVAVGSGGALLAVNGKVEGLDSLGGVIANEFGFLAAFVVPLLGISSVAAATRREEETGRAETVLAGQVARAGPVLAALVLACATLAATTVAFATGLGLVGVPWSDSMLYAASLGTLGFVFAALAALLAQLVRHARGVYGNCLLVLALAYVLRGVGDVTGTWLSWLSPLGWAEKAAPFGAARWWVLVVPLVVGVVLAVVATWAAARRDLGSALVRGSTGRASGPAYLRGPVGLAAWSQRSAFLGWLTGTLLVATTMGALAQQLLDAVEGNPAMARAIGVTAGRPETGVLAVTELYLALIGAGYAVQAVGSLRQEETAGLLEPRLAGTLSRSGWLAAGTTVVLTGLLALNLLGSVALAASGAWSLGTGVGWSEVLTAGLAYLPAQLVTTGLALAVLGARPRLYPGVWGVYALTTSIALLGEGLRLPRWVVDLAPTAHVGSPPSDTPPLASLAVLAGLAVALGAMAGTAFRRRDVPRL